MTARVRAVIIEGEATPEVTAAIREAIDSPELEVIYRAPSVAEIVAQAAIETGIKPAAILGGGRTNDVVLARFAVCWVSRRFGNRSSSQIGRALGGRNHATIISAIRRAEGLRLRDREFEALTDRLLAHFENGGLQ